MVYDIALFFLAWTVGGMAYVIWDNWGRPPIPNFEPRSIFVGKIILFGPIAWVLVFYAILIGCKPFRGEEDE